MVLLPCGSAGKDVQFHADRIGHFCDRYCQCSKLSLASWFNLYSLLRCGRTGTDIPATGSAESRFGLVWRGIADAVGEKRHFWRRHNNKKTQWQKNPAWEF